MALLARFTFREAARKQVLLGILVLTAIFLALFTLGSYFAFNDLLPQASRLSPVARERAISQVLLAGLYVTNLAAGLLAIFTSVSAIAYEVEQGTLHAILPKPIRRRDVLLGKWLGYAAMLALYVLATSVLVMGVVYGFTGYLPPRPLEGLALLVLSALLLLSITLLASSLLSTVTSGIVVFMLYAIATAAGMMEQLGSLLENETMIRMGIATSLVIPSDAIWKLASARLQPPISSLLEVMGPFAVLSPPSLWMAAYAALYAAVAVAIAVVAFDRKDL